MTYLKFLIVSFSLLFFCFFSSSVGFQTGLTKEHKKLMKTWHYAKCEILKISYPPERKELEDMLALHDDGSFIQIDDGERIEGFWEYLAEKKELLLKSADSEEISRLIVETLGKDELILRKSEAWRFDVIIYMIPANALHAN